MRGSERSIGAKLLTAFAAILLLGVVTVLAPLMRISETLARLAALHEGAPAQGASAPVEVLSQVSGALGETYSSTLVALGIFVLLTVLVGYLTTRTVVRSIGRAAQRIELDVREVAAKLDALPGAAESGGEEQAALQSAYAEMCEASQDLQRLLGMRLPQR